MTPTSAVVAGLNNPVSTNQLGMVYATKRRRRNGKSLKPTQKEGVTQSNPSKRHRERLNAELDTLASLLPFEQNILSKLDRLSILRLSVSYLRTKSYFQVVMHQDKEDPHSETHFRTRELAMYDSQYLDGEMFLQALNGFLLILTCDGEVFFATHTIESYLGFHQSDIVHQSVYELVHSEDREELQKQLTWNAFLPAEISTIPLHDALVLQNIHHFERSFTVRFRCLLDNTSGFLRLDVRGRVKILHGQNRKTEELPLALFALCTPFGPPSLLEVPQKEVMFKSKHKLDLTVVSMDQKGKMLLGYLDSELVELGAYDLVHPDDLAYVASAHQELLKTGASGMIAYRYKIKDEGWQWLQTSSRLVYKNSKPDFVISTHRPLMEEEGRDLLGKRTMDFKVSYLDAGLTNSYFSDSESLSNSSTTPVLQHQRMNRRYKTQLREFLSTNKSKKSKLHPEQVTQSLPNTSTMQTTEYLGDVPYSHLNAAYSAAGTYGPSAVSAVTETPLSTYINHPGPLHQTLYSSTTLDNRYLPTTDNIFQYRPLGTYFPEYHAAPAYNSFIDVTLSNYEGQQQLATVESPKYGFTEIARQPGNTNSPYSVSTLETLSMNSGNTASDITILGRDGSRQSFEGASISSNSSDSSPVQNAVANVSNNELLTMKAGNVKSDVTYSYHEPSRQTVLMWGTSLPKADLSTNQGNCNSNMQPRQNSLQSDPLRSLAEMNLSKSDCKWKDLSLVENIKTENHESIIKSENHIHQQHHERKKEKHNEGMQYSEVSVRHANNDMCSRYAKQLHNQSSVICLENSLIENKGNSRGSAEIRMEVSQSCLQSETSTSTIVDRNNSIVDSNLRSMVDSKDNESPLLSISEVTNTLLNQ